MKLLVTGAKGQVGSALCRLGALRSDFQLLGFDSRQLDITSEAAVADAVHTVRPDIVINAAAYTAVDRAESEQELAFRINGEAPGFLARACESASIPLLHFSTDYVFDGTKTEAYTESDPVCPLGIYGYSKLRGEQNIQMAGCSYLILRTSWVFGLEGHNFPKTMLRLAGERSELSVVNDQIGCPTFADDIASTVFKLVEAISSQAAIPWGLYHFAGNRPCSWYDVASLTIEKALVSGLIARRPLVHPISTDQYPTPARRPQNSRLSSEALKAAFPGVVASNWELGLEKLVYSEKNKI